MTTAEVKDEAARRWFGSTISSAQLPSRMAHWFSSWPAGMLTVAWGQLVVARSRCPEITMQPGGRSALTGFSPFPTQ